MTRLPYHPSVYDAARPAGSYWEATAGTMHDGHRPLAGDARCEVAVIGGGYTGLSAALHLARDHGVDVRVLEAGPMGWGASGRNGGFCGLSAARLSIPQLVSRYGREEARRFYASQLEAIELVRALGDDEGIDYDRRGDGNVTVAHKPAAYRELEQEAEQLGALCGIATRLYRREAFLEVGHDSTEQHGALHVAAGFALHPLKLALGLARAAARHGAGLHPRSRVLDWHRGGGVHTLATEGGRLRARRVLVATNGYTLDGLHPGLDRRFVPLISNVITTRPLTDEELDRQRWRTENPICNTRNLLFYYRLLPDRSFLFGARGDSTGRPAHAQRMRAWMVRRLGEVFPGWREVEVTHFWRGLVCMTPRFTPCVGCLDDEESVWCGFGYHGNGVNTAPWAGWMLARLIAGRARPTDVPAVLRGLGPRLPFAAVRGWAVRAGYVYYALRDAL